MVREHLFDRGCAAHASLARHVGPTISVEPTRCLWCGRQHATTRLSIGQWRRQVLDTSPSVATSAVAVAAAGARAVQRARGTLTASPRRAPSSGLPRLRREERPSMCFGRGEMRVAEGRRPEKHEEHDDAEGPQVDLRAREESRQRSPQWTSRLRSPLRRKAAGESGDGSTFGRCASELCPDRSSTSGAAKPGVPHGEYATRERAGEASFAFDKPKSVLGWEGSDRVGHARAGERRVGSREKHTTARRSQRLRWRRAARRLEARGHSFARPAPSKSTFSGFRSRWTTPMRCNAARPEAISQTTFRACASGNFPWRSSSPSRVPPDSSSRTSCTSVDVSKESTNCAWLPSRRGGGAQWRGGGGGGSTPERDWGV